MFLDTLNPRKKDFLACGIIVLAVMMAYANALMNGFVFDDQILIVNNAWLHQWKNWWMFFVSPHSIGGGVASPFYRPLQIFLYLVIYQMVGAAPLFYHALNIVLHAANACLVYVLGRRIGFRPSSVFIAALIWAVHPVQVEAVAYASATADVLYAFFCLLGLVLITPDFTTRRIVWSLPLFILALLSKESAIMFPVLAASLMYLGMRHTKDMKSLLRLWPLFFVAAIYAIAHMEVPIFAGFDLYNPPNACTNNMSCRAFTFLATLPAYLKIIVWPLHLHPERSVPLFGNLWDAQVVSGAGIIIAAVWLGFGGITSSRKKILFWALLWFFTADFLQTGILFPVNGLFMEHWLYLPSVGLFLGVAQILGKPLPHKMRIPALAAVILLVFALGIKTYQQNKTWRDTQTAYTNIFTNNNYLPRARVGFGSYYEQHGDKVHAIEQFNQAIIQSGDTSSDAQYGYGLALYKMAASAEDVVDAIAHFKRALELNPDSFMADQGLAFAYTSLGDVDQANYYQQQARVAAEKIRSIYIPSVLRDSSK